MQELSDDLLLELYKQNPAFVICCYEDADGKRHGKDEDNDEKLKMWEAVKDLPGVDKGPLIICGWSAEEAGPDAQDEGGTA
ncbi:MAG: hypothetical protein L6427_01685 [Actinomycetia bacterium]|nr:hypothetical protein [Actinomycetes bacterium]